MDEKYVLLTSEPDLDAEASMCPLIEAPDAVQSTDSDMPTLALRQQFSFHL